MARPRGALNKRTRAALHAAESGELGSGIGPLEYLLKVMRDADKPDQLRIEAAKSVAPYFHPKLSSTEVIKADPFDGASRQELVDELIGAIATLPLKEKNRLKALLDATGTVSDTMEGERCLN